MADPDYAGAVKSIEDRLTANWATTPIAFENDGAPSVVDGSNNLRPWVYCEVISTPGGIVGAGKPGAHVVVDEGLVQVIVFVPTGTGRLVARQYATAIGEIFRVKEFYNLIAGACVRTWTPEIGPGNRSQSENPRGSWWAVTVTIPFEFIHLA